MEKFAVDLDKVLDEFELNEDRAHELTAGQEEKPSGYREFLLATSENVYSYNNCVVPLPDSAVESAKAPLEAPPVAVSLRYDFPFEPADKINLYEADFSAGPGKASSHGDNLFGKVSLPTNVDDKFLLRKVNNEDKVSKPWDGSGVETSRIAQHGSLGNGDVSKPLESVECSADRLMNDIETAMVMGLSLPAASEHSYPSVGKPCSGSQTDLNGIMPTNANFGTDRSDPMSNGAVNGDNTLQRHNVPFCDRNDKAEFGSCSVAENGSESSSVSMSRTSVKSSPVFSNSDNVVNSGDSNAERSSIDYITNLLRQSAPPVEASEETLVKVVEIAKDSRACTPFETPVESPDAMVAPEGEKRSAAVPVGFSEPTCVTDAELEKYLKEAEDNEKISNIKSQIASVGAQNDGASFPPEHDAEGLSSGDEFYSPLMERSNFAGAADDGDQLRPDQTYEDVMSKVDDKMMNVEPPSVTENDVCPGLSGIHNKLVVMESQSTMSVCPTNTGTRPKSSTDVDKGNASTVAGDGDKVASESQDPWLERRFLHDAINRERAQRTKSSTEIHMVKEQQNLEIKNQLQLGMHKNPAADGSMKETPNFHPELEQDCRSPHPDRERVSLATETCVAPSEVDDEAPTEVLDAENELSEDDQLTKEANDSSRKQRPTSLNLTGKIVIVSDCVSGFENPPKTELSEAEEAVLVDGSTLVDDGNVADYVSTELDDGATAAAAMTTAAWTDLEAQIGKVAPFWIPDADASSCMQCSTKFTVIKRRHHCRACGRVLCGQCCAWKAKLQYMDNKEARVCQQCLQSLHKVEPVEQWAPAMASPVASPLPLASPLTPIPSSHFPNPNNPNEYCSTVPPLQQVRTSASAPPPTVMVPVGVLKREGAKTRGEPKQVMFSDGIRPGGDLTELDSPVDPKPPYRRQKRIQKRIEKIGDSETSSFDNVEGTKFEAGTKPIAHDFLTNNHSERFPLVMVGLHSFREYLFEENPDTEELFIHLQDKQAPPVIFAVNKNLFVHVKILTLDCCIKKTCWYFSTEGMGTVGQEELVVILECLPDEKIVPEDMFSHFNSVYEDASQGNSVVDLGHTIFTQSFLGSREHGGFLYVRPTFQCLNQLPLPTLPYLVGILLQKWETPWAKVFPIRLLLRLGSETRFYPCPLVSIRFRKPVYAEIGHTIMNLLADFRNYQYKLPIIRGMVIHMEEKHTRVNIPRNRYDEAMKALNNSNDHVLALGGNFSLKADSHLVCIQNDDGNYQTQAINIENKPRKVTGASFVVFNGALKSSSGLSAKSSIVEDGLMVQIPPDTMIALRQAMREMNDFLVKCGPLNADTPEEEVVVCWVEDDKSINVGVKSPIDGMSMEGLSSLHIHGGTDYVDQRLLIRWTEVFFIHADEETSSRRSEPINTSRLAEILAQACCMALTMHLKSLKEANLTKIGLRVTIDSENVGYEVGAQETKLPAEYMNDLDSELVPVIHRAASQAEDTSVTLELVFHIMEQ